jgi:hypothetical protein
MYRICAVKLLQETLCESSFATPRRAVEQNMGEVVTFCEFTQHRDGLLVDGASVLKVERAVLFYPQFLLGLH